MNSTIDLTVIENFLKEKSNTYRNLSQKDINNEILFENNNNKDKIKKYRQQGEYGHKKFIKP